MRKIAFVVSLVLVVFMFSAVYADVEGDHNKFLYPVIRVTHGRSGGSGTVIYSKQSGNQTVDKTWNYSTYVLTNYHVIGSAISIVDEWDSNLGKEVKKEKRDVVYIEFFEYKALSVPIGTLKIEADIVIYDKDQDLALLKTRSEKRAEYIASLYPTKKGDEIFVFDKTIAVGCSLGFPPIPTLGILTRKGFFWEANEFWLSSSQIIYGNSGGAMFLERTGELIGIPSLVAVVGWGTPITHMGLFIPIQRIYDWLEKEHYDFIWDESKTEKECLEIREKELEEKRKKFES